MRSDTYHERNLQLIQDRLTGNNGNGMTLEELGEKYNISRQRVYQIFFEYGVTDTKEKIVKKLADKLFDYICKYKYDHDGNSPNMTKMVRESKFYQLGRVRKALNYLHQNGKIIITKKGQPITIKNISQINGSIEIEIVGANWTPPVVRGHYYDFR